MGNILYKKKKRNCLKNLLMMIAHSIQLSIVVSNYLIYIEDLQFDFQGSFGQLNRQQHLGNPHQRYKSVGRNNTALVNPPTVSNLPRAPPSVMNSQFQSNRSGQQLLHQSNTSSQFNGDIKSNANQHQIHQQISLFDSNLLNNNHYQSQSSVMSTIHLPNQNFNQQESNRDQNVIKLPKLSFNDLIQAQNYDSFKNANKAALIYEDSCENVLAISRNTNEEIKFKEEEEEELRSQEMSAFQSAHKRDDSNVLRYSDQTNSFAMKLPKLKLIGEGEFQTIENQIFSDKSYKRSQSQVNTNSQSQFKRKQNVIDSNIKLALAFETRKLILKAWKSWIIIKMHEIHKQHLKRLAQSYIYKKIVHKHWQISYKWKKLKVYAKIIAPAEKQTKKAQKFYKQRLRSKVLKAMRRRTKAKKEEKVKLYSTMMVLRSQRLRQVFERFKQGIQKLYLQKTQKFTAFHIYFQKLELRALRSLQFIASFNRRQSVIRERTILFYQQSLAKRALMALKSNALFKGQSKKKLIYARVHFRNQHSCLIKNKSFQILSQFANHQKMNKKATDQRNFWLQHVYFKSFKFNLYLQRGVKTQLEFVERYHSHSSLVKVFKSLIMYTQQQQDRQLMVMNYLSRSKMRKTFRVLYKYKNKNVIAHCPRKGIFIQCARYLLENSFKTLMQSVWIDFPKQKMTVHPYTGRETILLNYLGLSKNPKYREYFWKANNTLRNFTLMKTFNGLKSVAQSRVNFRLMRQQSMLQKLFKSWEHKTSKGQITYQLVKSKQQKKRLLTLIKVFKAVKNHSKQHKHKSKVYYKLLKKRRNSLIFNGFRHWQTKFLKLQEIKHNEEMAQKLYKHRHLGRFLALWLQQLHRKLKLDHLDILRLKFQKYQVRRRFLRLWQMNFEKLRYLEQQEQNLNYHQTNLLLYKSFQQFKAFTHNQLKKKLKLKAAYQEYRYWLGKRALSQWHFGLNNLKSQAELYTYLEQDRNQKVMRKVFQFVALYKVFKQDRKIRDIVMTKAVHTLLKRGILEKWVNGHRKGLSTRMFASTLVMISKRAVFSKIRHVIAYQDSVVDVMSQKHSVYMLLRHFNLLRSARLKTNLSGNLHQLLQVQRLKTLISQKFNQWRSTYQARRKLYLMYAFTVIQLKNQFNRRVINDWKTYVNGKIMKKNSAYYLKNKRKRQVFKTLKLRYLKTQHIFASYDYLCCKRLRQQKSSHFQQWRELFLNQLQLHSLYLQHQQKKKKKCLQEFKTNQKIKQFQRKQFLQKVQTLKIFKMKQLIVAMKKTTSKIKINKEKVTKHQQTLVLKRFAKAAQYWLRFYKHNQENISQIVRVKRKHQKLIKKHFIKNWLIRASLRLSKLKYLKIMIKIKNKQSLDKRFAMWVDQTNFLIKLEQKTEQLAQIRGKKQKTQSIQQLQYFCHQRKIYKQREVNVALYSKKKFLLKSFLCFFKYVDHKKHQRNTKHMALHQYLYKLKKRTLKTLKFTTKKQKLRKKQTFLMKKYKKKIYGPLVFTQLAQNRDLRLHNRQQSQNCHQFRLISLINRVFTSLAQNINHHKTKKQLIQYAFKHQQFKMQESCFNKFKVFKCKHQIVKNKRKMMFQKIKHADQMVKKTIVFKHIKINKNREKQALVDNKLLLKAFITKRLFNLLRFNKDIKSGQRQAFELVMKKQNRKAKAELYYIWRKLFLQEIQIKAHYMEKAYKIKRDIFNYFIGKKVLRKKQGLILLSRMIKYKAIVLTVFIQYCQHRQFQAFKVQQATMQYKRHLTKSAFCEISQIKERKQYLLNKLSQILIKFEQLDKEACLKQWKKGAFFMKVCELIYVYRYQQEEDDTLHRCFTEWQRLLKHKKNKDTQYESLHSNHNYHTIREIFSSWKLSNNVRCQVLSMKLGRLIEPLYLESLSQIYEYSLKEQELNGLLDKYLQKKEKRTRKSFFYEWMIRIEQKEQTQILEAKRNTALAKKVMQAFEKNRLMKISDKYQMLRTISFFSERRSELLLGFSKTFLILNSENRSSISEYDSGYTKMCSTALAKYVLEKWKNAKGIIQVDNDLGSQANQFYIYSLAKRHFISWREQISVNCHKRSLKLSCQEFYYVSLIKKAFGALNSNLHENFHKMRLNDLQNHILSAKYSNIMQFTFQVWRNKFLSKVRVRTIEHELATKSHLTLLYQVFQAFKNYTMRNVSMRMKLENAQNTIVYNKYNQLIAKYFCSLKFYTRRVKQKRKNKEMMNEKAQGYFNKKLMGKIFRDFKSSIKELKHKSKYSKLYTVFVAWKFYIKEKTLLDKYLTECNYNSNVGKKHSRGSSQQPYPSKRGLSQQKENCYGMNESAHQLHLQRLQRQMDNNAHSDNYQKHGYDSFQPLTLLQSQSSFENLQQFTPTLGASLMKQHIGEKRYQSIMSQGSENNLKGSSIASNLQIFRQRFNNQ